ncbi:MAG: ribosome biogenesis GTPase YlqF [Clostridiales bacterium]|nr:ribosome biogenesis GTPase YlqF [Clostridiales bacterium]
MTINWYPGHMKKTKELIQENLKLIDVVVELLDARIPISSKNPQINELLKGKFKIVVFNKFDLADPETLESWIKYYKGIGIKSIPINCITGEGVNRLVHEIRVTATPIIDKLKAKGMKERPIRVMIVGIPNVGKSSLINKLAGKKAAKIGNRPGVTRGKQWIRIRKGMELFDTPGILWPKIESAEIGKNLAYVGSIKDEILDIEDIALSFLEFLMLHYPVLLMRRYNIDVIDKKPIDVFDEIAIKRGCIVKGGEINYHKISNILLDEYRNGKIGKISLEWPDGEK